MAFSAPDSRQIVRFLFAAVLASVLLLISGLSYTATVIFLVMATPAIVFFSPILVPAGIVTSLVISGFILSGGLAVVALPALSWIWKHVPRKRLFRLDQLQYALKRIENVTGEVDDENGEEEEGDDGEGEKKAEEVTETS